MRRWTNSLAFQIGVVIIVVEIIVLGVSGIILLRRFNAEIDRRIETRVQLPAKLMNAGQLGLDAVADRQVMQELVGEELLAGMVIGANQQVFFSLDPAYVGEDVRELPDLSPPSFMVTDPRSRLIHEGDSVVSVAPIFSEDGRTPRFFAYVKVSTATAQAARAALIRLFLFSTIVTVLATSLIIILTFHFLIFRRLAGALNVLQRVEAGDLTARTDAGRRQDEIGFLQRRVNRMVADLEEKVGALRESEARYRQLVENAPYGVIIHVDERIVYLNETAVAFLGASQPEQLMGTAIWQWVPAAYHDESRRRLRQLRETTERSPLWELKLRRLDGTVIDAEAVGIPFIYQGKTAVQTVFRDITESKRAEKALQQAQKLESLGIMAGGIAHDFNNLLVAILGQTSLAITKLSPQNPAYRHAEKATRAAERAADLTRQLLSYSGQGQLEIRPLQLNALVEENKHLFQVAVPKNVTLSTKLAGNLPPIEADAGQIQQVIMNLIINGAEAIGDQPGAVTIKTGVRDVTVDEGEGWLYFHPNATADRFVFLEVRDDGCGMNEATLAKIFDPFFTTKYTGRGLGLAAVLGIVRGHKGGLQVESQPGEGTTFRLFFPAASGQMAATKPAPAAVRGGERQGCVLVIDDEEPVREAVRDILEADGVRVLSAADGAAGVALYKEKRAEIQLVLLDLSMPGLGGAETLSGLQEINPEVRVILSSGYHQSEVKQRFVRLGVTDFLQKPYGTNRLIQIVREALK